MTNIISPLTIALLFSKSRDNKKEFIVRDIDAFAANINYISNM